MDKASLLQYKGRPKERVQPTTIKFYLYTIVQEAFASRPGASRKLVARKARVTNHLNRSCMIIIVIAHQGQSTRFDGGTWWCRRVDGL